MPITPAHLEGLTTFEQLAELFHQELGWPRPDWPTFQGVAALYDLATDDIPGVTSLAAVEKLSDDQTWGIFLVDFGPNELKRQDLRRILHRVADRARQAHSNPTWPYDNILFVCRSTVPEGKRTAQERDQLWTFAYYTGNDLASARLRTFGWDNPDEARTAVENVNLLAWTKQLEWAEAWRVEKLTKTFFKKLSDLFFETLDTVTAQAPDLTEPRLFVQMLFNRLLFVRFLEERRKLQFRGQRDYLKALWKEAKNSPKPMWPTRVNALFQALNNPAGSEAHVKGEPLIDVVPYLNGGLFDDDQRFVDPRIKIPPAFWERLLGDDGLLYAYNFTAEESTPEHIHVAIDPEMLGRIFEQLTIAKNRHDTGSYYTPRDIVQFMCREAIINYLVGKGIEEQPARKLVYEHDKTGITDTQGDVVWQALQDVKVVDPACGSGAYLLGMLQELFALYNLFNRPYPNIPVSDQEHQRKLHIIENCIYGVDFQAFAVNTAMLRLWLTLMVQDESPVPKALPNLDYKIEEGDSLMGPNPQYAPNAKVTVGKDKTSTAQAAADFGDTWDLIRELRDLREKYQNAHGPDKPVARREFDDKLKPLRKEITGSEEKVKGAFDWRVEFFDVFLDDPEKRPKGFDIVVANPPYVNSGELLRAQGKDYKDRLIKAYPETAVGTADLLVYFVDRGVQLLGVGGQLVFITSNKWLKASYGQKLRSYFARHTLVHHLIDFGDLPVFDGVIAYPLITIATKTEPASVFGRATATRFTPVNSLKPPFPDLSAIIEEWGGDLSPDALGKDGTWRLETGQAAERLAKMRERGLPLGEYVKGKIYYGIKTGLNEVKIGSDGKMYGKSVPDGVRVVRREGVFVINGAKRAELIAEDPKSAEIIKPLAIGRDIKRWLVEDNDRWLIVTRIGTDMSRYPAIMRHLSRFEALLRPRADQGEHWWELRACAYYDEFDKPKLLWGNLNDSPTYGLAPAGMFVNAPAVFSPIEDYYLAALLNSQVGWQLLTEKAYSRGGGFFETKPVFVTTIPIPEASDEDKKLLTDLVTAIATRLSESPEADISDLEAEINRRVEFLYFGEGDSYEDALAKDAADIRMLLRPRLETSTLEFKETLWHDVRLNTVHGDRVLDVAKAICAMLNRDGGTVLIGVTDDAEIVGIERDLERLETLDKFQRKLQEAFGVKLRPDPTDLVRVRFIPIDGKTICRVDVKPDASMMFTLNDKVYVRRDGASVEMSPMDTALWWARRQKGEGD